MPKRSRLEIIYSILGLVRQNDNSIKPTPLLRYTNISSQSFSEYCQELLEKQLIREITDKKGKKTVSLTDNGFKFLEKYRILTEFIEEFEL